MIHELKTDPDFFEMVKSGEKTFELRFNDRGFQVGDTLVLRKTLHEGYDMKHRGFPLVYTGDELLVKVTLIIGKTRFSTLGNWVVMGIVKEPV